MKLFLLFSSVYLTVSFIPSPVFHSSSTTTRTKKRLWLSQSIASTASSDSAAAIPTESIINIDPKEAVKLFGRLADKYIMLDASAGQCCYSGCQDCEFRLPGGGYRMADQSSSRPKWIPNYDTRQANGKEHRSKWSQLFDNTSDSLSQQEFVDRLVQLEYVSPLGGPYVAASAASIDDMTSTKRLFQVLAGSKETLTRKRMSKQIRRLANGEEGLTWANFLASLVSAQDDTSR